MGSDGGSQKNNALPPFLAKTYDMVDDPSTDPIVSWSSTGSSFVVWNCTDFSRDMLPQYFKHNNFSSFVRQLNTYGFRKICPDQWEFATEGFLKGQRDALKSIRRRKPLASSSSQAHDDAEHQQLQLESPKCTILGHQELEGEVKRLEQDKKLLVDQLAKIQREQQTTETNLVDLGKRLQALEARQHQIMSFLARLGNPAFWAQFVQNQTENNMLLTFNKKRRLLANEEILVGMEEHQEVVVGTGELADDNENIAGRTRTEKDALGTWWNNSNILSSADVPCEGILRQLNLCPQNQSLGNSPISLSSGVFLREVQTPAECPDEEVVVRQGEHQQILAGTGESGDDNGNIVGRTTDKHISSKRVSSADVPYEGISRQLSLCPPCSQSSPMSFSSATNTLRGAHTAECLDRPVNDVCNPVASAGHSSEMTDYSTWERNSRDDRVALSMHLRDRLRSLVSSAPKSSEKKFRKSAADGSGSNDGFWEKYLTESPCSTDTEPDSENESFQNDASPRERQFL